MTNLILCRQENLHKYKSMPRTKKRKYHDKCQSQINLLIGKIQQKESKPKRKKEKEKRHECHIRILILHDTWGATIETKKVHIKANVPHPKIRVDTFKIKKIKKKYVYNIFTTNYRWLVVIGSNLNLTLRLLFYLNNNNLLLRIYCKNVVNISFLLK